MPRVTDGLMRLSDGRQNDSRVVRGAYLFCEGAAAFRLMAAPAIIRARDLAGTV
jgi:hypothetical protein